MMKNIVIWLAVVMLLLPPSSARAGEEINLESAGIPDEKLPLPCWHRYGPLKEVVTVSRTQKTRRRYTVLAGRILETIRRGDEKGDWRKIPITVNTYDAGFRRVLKSEYAFDEDNVSRERREYEYDAGQRLEKVITYRSTGNREEEIINIIRFKRDELGRIRRKIEESGGQTLVVEEHSHVFDADAETWTHYVKYREPRGKTTETTFLPGGGTTKHIEKNFDRIVNVIEYNGDHKPVSEIRYEDDARYFEKLTWSYEDGHRTRMVQDFSRSSFPELDKTIIFYRYRFGRLHEIVKANAKKRVLAKTRYIYRERLGVDDYRWRLPVTRPPWWASRPVSVEESWSLPRGNWGIEYAISWSEAGCAMTRFFILPHLAEPYAHRNIQYDSAGRLSSIADCRDNAQTVWQFSPDLAYPVKAVYCDAGGNAGRFHFEYLQSQVGNLLAVKWISQHEEISLETYQYEESSSMAVQTIHYPESDWTVRNSFNLDGRILLSEVCYNNQVITKTEYNRRGAKIEEQHFDIQGCEVQAERWKYRDGRLLYAMLRVKKDCGELPPGEYKTDYEYDANGKMAGAEKRNDKGRIVYRLKCRYDIER
ncbi:hypothetical protein ACFL54_06915 [Planctomycetota bacterium]